MYSQLKNLFSLLIKSEKIQLAWLLFYLLIGSVLEIITIGSIPLFINSITNPDSLKNSAFFQQHLSFIDMSSLSQTVIYGSLIIIVLYLIKNSFMTYILYYKSTIATNIQIRIGYTLLEKYFSAPYTFHLRRNSMDLFSKVFDESRIIINSVLIPVISLVMDITFALSIIILLFVVEPVTSITTFATLTLLGYTFLRVTKNKITRYGRELPFLRSKLNKSVTEGLNGLKDSRVLNREYYFLDHTHKVMSRTYNFNKYQLFIGQLTKPVIETIVIISLLGICVSQILIGKNIDQIVSTLTLFAVASIRLLPSINQILSSITSIRNSLFTIDPVYKDFVELKNEHKIFTEADNSGQLTFSDSIHINNIHFSYPEANKPSLNNLSLTLRKGDAIGLIGSSGAGKTTLVDIILGLLQPSEGEILVDEKNIQDHMRAWQKNIGYIPQFIFLSDNTIKKNIAFGIPDEQIDDEKLWSAIKAAQLESLINELSEGLETEIGERGIRLSGGQRQRIGIARALYHNPQVLIMDEATSALDNITEKYVVEAIDRLKGDRTIITIAHRLTTVKNCDCLYLMKGGKIVASGTYDDLLSANEEFKKMNI